MRFATLAGLTLLLSALPARAQTTYSWTGRSGVSDYWTEPGNWQPSGVPGSGDIAVLNAYDASVPGQEQGPAVGLVGSVTVAGLVLSSSRQNGAGLTVGLRGIPAATITVTGSFSFSAGTLSAPALVCTATCTGTISGPLFKWIGAGGGLVNFGTIAWEGGENFRLDNGPVTNHGTFRLDGAGTFVVDARNSMFVNRGLLVKGGGGTTFFGEGLGLWNEGGIVRAEGGTLALMRANGQEINGTFRSRSRLEGPGLIRLAMSSGTDVLRWTDTTTVAGPVEIADRSAIGGTFAFETCEGCLRWTGGSLVWTSPSGTSSTVTLLTGSTLDVESATAVAPATMNGSSLVNRGAIRWHGPNPLVWTNGGTLTNEGTLELIGDGQAITGPGGVTIVNRGLIARRGSGTTWLNAGLALRNEGAVIRVEEGTLAAMSPSGIRMTTMLLDGSRVEGAGLLRIANQPSGGQTWAGTTTVTAGMELVDGTFAGDFTLVACEGCLRWTGGRLDAFGGPTFMRIPVGSFLDVDGPADKIVTATIVNAGTARWRAGRIVGGGTIRNEGRFEAAPRGFLGVVLTQATPGAQFATAPGLDTLTVQFALTLTAGRVEMQLGPDGRSDRIIGQSAITLGAALIVSAGEPYAPAVGDAFTLMRGNSLTGTASDVTGLGLGDVSLTPSYTAQEMRLTVAPGTGAPALAVVPNPVQGGAIRTLDVGGSGFTAGTMVRLECTACADPANHGVIAGTVTSWTPTRLMVTVDLRPPDAFGGYDVVVLGPGAGRVPLPVLPVPLTLTVASTAPASEDGPVAGRVTITANRLTEAPRTVGYTLGGTALLYTDYTTDTPRGRVALPAGRRTVDVLVMPLQDALAEPTETVVLTLATGPGYSIAGPAAGTVDLADGPSTAELRLLTVLPTGAGNDGPVTLAVVAQGLSPDATVRLEGPAIHTPTNVGVSSTVVSGSFTFDAVPTGLYDVVVTSGGEERRLAGAFTVVPAVAPQLSVAVAGPGFFRPGQVSTYTVTVTNHGNVDAVAVPLTVAAAAYPGAQLVPYFPILELPPVPVPDWPGTWDTLPVQLDTLGQLLRPLILPVVPANESLMFPFRTTTYRFQAWAGEPLLDSFDPDAPPNAAYVELMQSADRAQDLENCLVAAASLTIDVIPGLSCLRTGLLWMKTTLAGLYNTHGSSTQGQAAFNMTQVVAGAAGVALDCATDVNPFTKAAKVALKIATLGLSGVAAVQACGPFFARRPGDSVDSDEVSSYDPNDKLGPDGYGPLRYTSARSPFGYVVRFENLATATAPAAEVVVVDTLDAGAFDLSTFRVGAFAYGDSTVVPPPGLRAFAAEQVLPNGMLLQTTGHLDDSTGRVVWRFTTLDPITREMPEDPFLGFLPPNVSPPEGEGSVTFTVAPRAGLPTGATAENRARIVFDFNDPIDTPPWLNALDYDRPVSAVQALLPTQSDSTFLVRWSGSDVGAGVVAYDVFVQEDGGPFHVWLAATPATEAVFEGQNGVSYGFFSIALDGADNVEPPKTTAEATTQVVVGTEVGSGLPTVFSLEPNRPNPFAEATVVRFGLPTASRVTVTLYDVVGREVARLVDAAERPAGWHDVRFDAQGLASGVYLYRMEAGDFTAVRRMTLVR